MDAYTLLVIGHLAGTILGVGGATMIEVHLNRSLRNKELSTDEKNLLEADYRVVRIGLVLSLFTGFGFLLFYSFQGVPERLYNPIMWAKILIVIMIAVNAVLLQARKISLYWGAGLSFVSWWMAALLGVFTTNGVRIDFFNVGGFGGPFVSMIILYMVAVVAGSYILHLIRKHLY